MSHEQAIQMGESAKAVLENEAFIAAFAAVKQELTDQWTASPVRDADAREKIYLMIRMLERSRLHLESMVTSGKMAQADRKTLADRVARARDELFN